jgi:hypothetical protein
MKKGIKIALLSVLGLVIVTGVLVWMEFGPLVKGAISAEKLDDGLYYMEYKGDDGFKELMDRGGCNDISVLASFVMEFLSKGYFKPDSIDVPIKPVGCSTLTVKTPEDGVMMARNFDYPYGTALIMHTIPDEGYESITTFSTDFFGFGENYKPKGFRNQYMALTGLFLALDGLNEKGFAIAVLDAGDKVVTRQNTSKPDLTTTTAVQYLLKNATNIDEALALLKASDMNSDPGSAYHFSMADATGRSVAVEYVENQMVVTESPFVTNHYLCEWKFQTGLHESDHRHEKLMEQYDAAGGVMNADQLTETIASVTQLPEKGAIVGGTLWTMVMDLTHPSVTYYSLRHFDKPFHFALSRTK